MPRTFSDEDAYNNKANNLKYTASSDFTKKYQFFYFCPTFKLSDERAWRGACCSEHDP